MLNMQFRARESGIDYSDFGISDLNSLGCVMYDLEFREGIINEIVSDYGFEPYTSPDPKQWWVDGIAKDHHVTLRYGLLPNVRKKHVMQVLPEGLIHSQVRFAANLDYFPGFNDKYFVMILRLGMYDGFGVFVQNCHNALGLLPNVQTFSPPEFHVTLGYFTGDPTPIRRLGRTTIFSATTKGVRCGKSMRP